MITQKDSLAFLQEQKDFAFDINYSDPPYALGSEIYIRPDGKFDYKKATDFMNKWDMPTGEYWEQWFEESFRTLKHGGYCIMFGIDRQLPMFQYYAIKAGFQVRQSMYWYFICNDEKTELLTKRGWIKHNEILNSDIVLTMNTNTEKSEWKSIQEIHKFDVLDLDMVRLKNRDIDQLVTPNHRILHKSKTNPRYNYGEWVYKQAYTFLEKKQALIKIPLAFKNLQGKEEYGEKMCHLIGWILTDGYYQKGDNSIRISQSSTNITKVEIIRDLLLSLNINFKEYNRERNYNYKKVKKKYIEYVFYFNGEESIFIKDLFPNKIPTYDLLDLTYNERYHLFLGMMAGDGSFKMMNKYTNIYEALESVENFNGSFTKNKQTAEFLQALATSLGFSTSIYSSQNKTNINISWKQTTGIQEIKDKIFTEKYSGKVWSITTENSNYCIRRNGKVSFTGNSNFPKASCLSKNLDKNAKAERVVVGKKVRGDVQKAKEKGVGFLADPANRNNVKQFGYGVEDLTIPSTDLAKKYEGYKYSIAPLKQTCETIMVFQKPYLTGSCLHDTLAYENGDETCACFAWNIDGGRVSTNGEKINIGFKGKILDDNNGWNNNNVERTPYDDSKGRYPSQTFCDSGTAERLDEQSGSSKSAGGTGDASKGKKGVLGFEGKANGGFGDIGGCSKILHKCDYENGEMDLYVYAPKVSKTERNAGCDELDDKHFQMRPFAEEGSDMSVMKNRLNSKSGKNNHPTLKPISLSYRVLTLFKTPNPQKIIYPFAGVQSEVIGGYKAGFIDFLGCELNAEYVDIGNVRFEHWKDKPFNEKGKVVEPKKETKSKEKKEEKPKKKPNEQLKLL